MAGVHWPASCDLSLLARIPTLHLRTSAAPPTACTSVQAGSLPRVPALLLHLGNWRCKTHWRQHVLQEAFSDASIRALLGVHSPRGFLTIAVTVQTVYLFLCPTPHQPVSFWSPGRAMRRGFFLLYLFLIDCISEWVFLGGERQRESERETLKQAAHWAWSLTLGSISQT